jgi:DNA-binding NarL/FixJ family response regulator
MADEPAWQVALAEIRAFLTGAGAGEAEAALSTRVVLSPRQREVLRLIAAGKTNRGIAEERVISINTVQRHVSNIFAKTGLANRTEAAAYATRNGLA